MVVLVSAAWVQATGSVLISTIAGPHKGPHQAVPWCGPWGGPWRHRRAGPGGIEQLTDLPWRIWASNQPATRFWTFQLVERTQCRELKEPVVSSFSGLLLARALAACGSGTGGRRGWRLAMVRRPRSACSATGSRYIRLCLNFTLRHFGRRS